GESLRDRPRPPVLDRDRRRQPLAGLRRHRRREDAVLALADTSEAPQQLARIGLAAAELARDERQQRDPDHLAILDAALSDDGACNTVLLGSAPRLLAWRARL